MLRGLRCGVGFIFCGLLMVLMAVDPSNAQETKIPRIGLILLGGPGPSDAAIRKGFADLGYVEGQSIILELRFAHGDLKRAREFAAELVTLKVDVIAGAGLLGVGTAREFTKTIPIVFSAAPDPAALGYVASLERPGANLTGITSFDPKQAAEQLAILQQVVPKLSRISVISDAGIPRVNGRNPLEHTIEEAAQSANIHIHWVKLEWPKPDIATAVQSAFTDGSQAIIVLEATLALFHLKAIAEQAAKHRLPTVFPGGWPSDGLIKYGTSILYATPRIPYVVDKILKGANPAELPIEVVTKRELVINLKTAVEIGVTIPSELLKRADRVVQ